MQQKKKQGFLRKSYDTRKSLDIKGMYILRNCGVPECQQPMTPESPFKSANFLGDKEMYSYASPDYRNGILNDCFISYHENQLPLFSQPLNPDFELDFNWDEDEGYFPHDENRFINEKYFPKILEDEDELNFSKESKIFEEDDEEYFPMKNRIFGDDLL